MDFILSASLFFGGALSYAIISKFLKIQQTLKFTISVTDQILTLLSVLSLELSMALKMKYEALEEANTSPEEMAKIIEIDRNLIHVWKMQFAQKAFNNYPKQYKKILPTFDWDGALKPLDDTYNK